MTTPKAVNASTANADIRPLPADAAAEVPRAEKNPEEEKPFRGWALLGFLVLVILFIAGVSALIDVIADVA